INCLSHSSASNTQYLHGQKEKPSQRSHQTGQVPFNACAAVFWHGGPSEDLLSQEIPLPLDMGKGGFQWGFYGNTEPEELAALCVRGQRQQVLEVLSGDIVKVASSQLDATGASALHLAVLGGHLVFTQELIAASCDVNARDHQDKTPLHIASAEGYAELALELLVAGAGANDLDSMGQTPLHAASFTENLDLISVLLDHGVDPTLRDAHGRTAAFIAAEKGKISFLSLLLEKEPGLALIPNNEFWTPLHVAAWGMQSVKNFTRPLKFLESLKLLLTAKAEADAKDENCCTPMHRAAQAGNSDTLQVTHVSDFLADKFTSVYLHHLQRRRDTTVKVLMLFCKPGLRSPWQTSAGFHERIRTADSNAWKRAAFSYAGSLLQAWFNHTPSPAWNLPGGGRLCTTQASWGTWRSHVCSWMPGPRRIQPIRPA
ncbi:unnamed protein product, partial [Effrenium voratum]